MSETFIICGPAGQMIPGELALCSKCGAEIWPTSGTLERARRENISLICMDCFAKFDDDEWAFGGVMHHGEYMGPVVGDLFQALIMDWRKRQGGQK